MSSPPDRPTSPTAIHGGDCYDGDTDALIGDHPRAISTANFAELFYRLAHEIGVSAQVPQDALAAPFLTQVGATSATSAVNVVTALRDAGDRMLHALIFHSDHPELSEQFDAFSGYEKRVTPLLELRRVPLSRADPQGDLITPELTALSAPPFTSPYRLGLRREVAAQAGGASRATLRHRRHHTAGGPEARRGDNPGYHHLQQTRLQLHRSPPDPPQVRIPTP